MSIPSISVTVYTGDMGKLTRKLRPKLRPRCIVIAGPNGAGKTTFAREYLPGIAKVMHFVNADLIAGGLSPLQPELAAIAAARMVLREIDRLAAERVDFAFETTLSGRTYERRVNAWKHVGYRIEIVFLRLRSVDLALRRIETRVRQGGHDVPNRDVLRRLRRGWENFQEVYRPMAESWAVYDNSELSPQLQGKEGMKSPIRPRRPESFSAGVGRALRRAAKTARKTARMHGTPIYVVEDGKIVAKRP
jgi:predicted ABC-type ATPase